MYTISISISLGKSYASKTLVSQLVDSGGNNITDIITDGFHEIGNGNYLWTYDSFPSGFRGGVKFFLSSDLSEIISFLSINPEDIEYIKNINSVKESSKIKITFDNEKDQTDISSGTSQDTIIIKTGVN